jgi:hypothetical protein
VYFVPLFVVHIRDKEIVVFVRFSFCRFNRGVVGYAPPIKSHTETMHTDLAI